MPARSKSAPDKPLTLYRVFIDYTAAGVDTSSSTADKKIYENRNGVNQKISAALEMGVHPDFIQVMAITATWQPALDYEQMVCRKCNLPYDEPSDDCPQLKQVLRINEARERARVANPRFASRNTVQPLKRPHPELFVIEEVSLI